VTEHEDFDAAKAAGKMRSFAFFDGEVVREHGLVVPAGLIQLILRKVARVRQIRTAKFGPFEVGGLEIGANENRFLEVGEAQVGSLKISPAEIGPLQLGGAKDGVPKIGPAEDGFSGTFLRFDGYLPQVRGRL
jgi:hypothetical protein